MQDELRQDNPEAQDNNDELYERFSFKTDKGQEPLRIDKFLMNRIEGASRNKLQQAINAHMVLVNDRANSTDSRLGMCCEYPKVSQQYF